MRRPTVAGSTFSARAAADRLPSRATDRKKRRSFQSLTKPHLPCGIVRCAKGDRVPALFASSNATGRACTKGLGRQALRRAADARPVRVVEGDAADAPLAAFLAAL